MPCTSGRVAATAVSSRCLLLFLSLLVCFSDVALSAEVPASLTVRPNGLLVSRSVPLRGDVQSEDGRFWASFRVAAAGDEVRDLVDFALWEDERLLWRMAKAPGSDLYISNAGLVAFVAPTRHWAGEVTIHFYSREGRHLMSLPCQDACLFGFSPRGNLFGVGSARGLQVVDPASGQVTALESALQFDFSEDESVVALALPARVLVTRGASTLFEVATGLLAPRVVRVSVGDSLVAVADRQVLLAFSWADGRRLVADTLRGTATYRDLRLVEGKIVAGVQVRSEGYMQGMLRVLDRSGRLLAQELGERLLPPPPRGQAQGMRKQSDNGVPWPFAPFDSMRTVWNYYEQHMAYDTSSYLHQGLDLITPIGEPVYAVEPGIVKCVLTLGGNSYWRLAIAPTAGAESAVGWLYAHLVKESIACAVGDTVQLHDYLGQIIRWTANWGHIHFVQIQDTGLVWRYDDGEWGIAGNPLLLLRPNTDVIRPRILPVFPESKFAICRNESNEYLRPDSVFGEVDLVVRAVDWIGDSLYELPPYELLYWIINLERAELAVRRRLAQRLNHAYPFYAATHYQDYATLIYKRDTLLPPPDWMPNTRAFFHVLTNSDGDEQLDLAEHQLSFVSTSVPDGMYRIHVMARDIAGNATRDSMDIRVRNAPLAVQEGNGSDRPTLRLLGVFPNPFNRSMRVWYSVPEPGEVVLGVFDVRGREVRRLVQGAQPAGQGSLVFDADGLASGVYFLQLRHGAWYARTKCVLVR